MSHWEAIPPRNPETPAILPSTLGPFLLSPPASYRRRQTVSRRRSDPIPRAPRPIARGKARGPYPISRQRGNRFIAENPPPKGPSAVLAPQPLELTDAERYGSQIEQRQSYQGLQRITDDQQQAHRQSDQNDGHIFARHPPDRLAGEMRYAAGHQQRDAEDV